MSERTEIAWTDATWNPWQGCHKVSEACANCYMFREKKRYGQEPSVVVRSAPATFRAPLKWANNREKYGHISRVFTCSWSDFFIEEADAWREEAWEIMRSTPGLTYQILTKRPERFRQGTFPRYYIDAFPNVWLGITAENQPRLRQRWADMMSMFWQTNFISIEPMLGPIDLKPLELALFQDLGNRAWVICGCESGPNARETNIDWVRSLRDQCVSAGVPFFLKQLMIDGKLVTTPELDGRTWTEFPQ